MITGCRENIKTLTRESIAFSVLFNKNLTQQIKNIIDKTF